MATLPAFSRDKIVDGQLSPSEIRLLLLLVFCVVCFSNDRVSFAERGSSYIVTSSATSTPTSGAGANSPLPSPSLASPKTQSLRAHKPRTGSVSTDSPVKPTSASTAAAAAPELSASSPNANAAVARERAKRSASSDSTRWWAVCLFCLLTRACFSARCRRHRRRSAPCARRQRRRRRCRRRRQRRQRQRRLEALVVVNGREVGRTEKGREKIREQ